LYNIVVQDANGCISVDSVSVIEPPVIAANLTSTNPTCSGVCDGTITANPTNGNGSYTYLWSTGATTSSISNLCAGTYSVTISDTKGCSIIDSVTLVSPTSINLTVSGTDATCFGNCDGTALVTASGGTPPYSYLWSNGQVNSLATGLCTGSYTVTVTDANGCAATSSVVINEPVLLSTASTVTDVSCYGVCDGTIVTNPSGGTTPYTYVWSDGQTTQTAVGLCAGVYDVIVVDANNCTAYDTLTVNNPTAIAGNIVVNNATCNVCDGDATANPTNGVAPYTYVWSDGQTTQTAVGLCAGIYFVTITDNAGCSKTDTVIINNATGPNLSMSSTNETCSGLCNGTATVTASGGTTPYTYQWDDANNQTTATATNLCAGFYTVMVTDANNCSSIDTVTIQTSSIGATIVSTTDVSCFGNCDGTAVANATSGTPNYTYIWTPTGQTTPSATNLCAGNYVVTITDANNCSDSVTATINQPLPLSTSIISTNISCNGSCNGSATVIVSGGTAPYSYNWNTIPAQNTQSISNLCAGQYIVTVTDANNCTITDTVVITEPFAIIPNETLTNPGCGICDGSITLNPTGGTAPYSYNWSNGAVTPVVNNLCAGSYTVDITDATGCTLNYTIALSSVNAPVLTINSTDVSCNNACDGQITVSATGGNSPYSYVWTPGNQTTQTITGQCAGIYSVNVTDAANCVAVAIDTINEPDAILANITGYDVLCNGDCNGSAVSVTLGGTPPYSYSWNDPNNQTTDSIIGLCAGMVQVTITDNNGCSVKDSVLINQPSAITLSVSNTNVSCSSNCDATASVSVNGGLAPYSYNWTPSGYTTQSVANVCFGTNTVTVTDNNGCSVSETFNVAANDTVLAIVPADTAVCLGAVLQVTGSSYNANTVEWIDLSTGNTVSNTDTLAVNTLVPGTFCFVYFAYGNCTASDTICITIEDIPVVDAGPNQTVFEGTVIQLNASGGVSYTWQPADSLVNNTIPNPTDTVYATTTYYVTAVSAAGCIGTDSVTITVIPKINFPDGITPNGDGKNDTWVIDFINEYPNAVVEIYNRWGELLYRSEDYQNDWDGTYKGKPLPVGTYYYVIDLNEEGLEPFTGPITIMR
jgi:gliding motility-associated-like protein